MPFIPCLKTRAFRQGFVVKLTDADWFVILIFLGMIALSVFIGNQAKGALV